MYEAKTLYPPLHLLTKTVSKDTLFAALNNVCRLSCVEHHRHLIERIQLTPPPPPVNEHRCFKIKLKDGNNI